MKSLAILAMGAALMTVSATAPAQQPTLNPADEAQIRASLQGMDDAWNHHDMKAFVSFMSDDVQWVNVVGMVWKGKDQVFRAHEAFHRSIFKARQLYPPDSIDLHHVAPDTVVVTLIQRADGFTTPSGHTEPAGRSALTEVFVRRNGHWLLVEGHNTTVNEEAVRSNPIR